MSENFGIFHNLTFGETKSLSEFNIENGLRIGNATIHFPLDHGIVDNYTFFITFKHDTSFTKKNSYAFGFGNPTPYVIVENIKFILTNTKSSKPTEEDILPSHRNRQIMLWFVVKGNKHQVALFQGFSNITKTFDSASNISSVFKVHLPYFIQKMGYSKNAYEVNGKEYWKMAFIEKTKGTYFS